MYNTEQFIGHTDKRLVPRGIQNFKEEGDQREPRPLVKLTEVAFAVPPFPHGSSTTKSQREKKTPRLQLHSTSYVGNTEKLLDPVRQSWLFKKPSSPQGNKQLIFLTQPVLRPTIQPWFAVGLLSKFNHNRPTPNLLLPAAFLPLGCLALGCLALGCLALDCLPLHFPLDFGSASSLRPA